MPRSKANLDDTVSLFPFLDIMACLIGILVLLITAVTLAQISNNQEDPEDTKAVAEAQQRVMKYRQVVQAVEQDRRERERLEKLIAEAEMVQQQLAQVEPEVTKLEAERREIEAIVQQDPQQAARLQEQAKQQEQQIKQDQERLRELQRQRDELKKKLESIEQPPPEAEIQIVPSGSGSDLKPTFVECAAGAVVLHDGPKEIRIPVGSLADSEPFANLMERVKRQAGGSIIFLVRPDGISTYNTARNLARQNYVTNGKLAVAGHGKLDLSLFQPGGAKP
ncbi:MAG: hypothetical protein KJ000_27600 [Pirellulaceae bacterium]|nr:hypothetical protein [Pirellulaceae bacterium]